MKHPGRALAMVAAGSILVVLTPLTAGFVIGGAGGFQSSCTNSVATGNAANNLDLFQAIFHDSGKNNDLALAMLVGSNLESGWSNTAEGGGAFGPFQIQDPGVVNQGVTIAQAEDPAFATNYMFPRYANALSAVNPSLWSTDPERAAEQVAFLAERPLQDYYTYRGVATVNASYAASIQVMQRYGSSTNFGSGGATVTKASPASDCSATVPNASGLREIVLKAAASQLGVPYVWGGNTPRGQPNPGFDCSGLVWWSFLHIGVTNLTRTSQSQWAVTNSHTVTTTFSQIDKLAVPGDLIFFVGVGDGGTMTAPGHVAIYWGNGQMIAAPQSGENVQIEPIPTTIGFVGVTDPYFLAAGGGGAGNRPVK